MMKLIQKIKSFLSKPDTINAFQFVLVIIIALFSAYCTFELTMATFHSKAIAWMLTIIVEGSLTLFSFKFHAYSKKYVLIWIPYLIVSIIASQGALIGDADVKKSEKIHSSAEYKNYESEVQTTNAQLATYQSRLSALNSKDYSKEITDINKRLADKRAELKNTISTEKTQRKRSDIQKEIDSLEKSKTQLLDAENKAMQEANSIRASMDSASSKKDNLKNSLADDLKLVGGVAGAFTLSLANLNVSDIQFWTMFFILLEITRFILLKDSRELYTSITGNNPPNNKKPVPEFTQESTDGQVKKMPKIAHANNVVSIASKGNKDYKQTKNEQDLSNADIKSYINEMYNTAKEDISKGYKSIAKAIGMRETKAYKIKNHLEKLGIIEVNGATTKIVATQAQALLAVRRGA